jgi:tetratricopeptide (TPR) repeat protein
MKKKVVLSLFILMFLISYGNSENLEELFNRANQAYRAEKYEDAIELYKSILSQGFENADLYYNIGNCYFRLDQVGQAVLHYEKAKKINPNESDLNYNLELANLRVVDRIQVPVRFFMFDWWDHIKWYFSLNNLVFLLIALYCLSGLMFIVWLFVRWEKLRSVLISSGIVLGLLFIFWAYIFFLRIDEYRNRVEGIILSPSVTVVSAPDDNSADMFILHEGVKVLLNEQRDAWVNISLVDGKSGWIKYDVLGII